MNLCSFGIHKWGKWSEPNVYSLRTDTVVHGRVINTRDRIVNAQERDCERCGKHEYRVLDMINN